MCLSFMNDNIYLRGFKSPLKVSSLHLGLVRADSKNITTLDYQRTDTFEQTYSLMTQTLTRYLGHLFSLFLHSWSRHQLSTATKSKFLIQNNRLAFLTAAICPTIMYKSEQFGLFKAVTLASANLWRLCLFL